MGNIKLLPFTAEDETAEREIEELWAALPPETWAHIPGGHPSDPDELRNRMISRTAGEPPRCRTWLIRQNSALIGTTSHVLVSNDPLGLEIGATLMSPDTWGTGVNSRVKQLMLGAVRSLEAERAHFRTDERNLRSAAAIRKLGAVPNGTRIESIIRPDGTTRTSLLFVLEL